MYKLSVLDNGLTVVTCSMPHVRSVSVALATGAGSCYEPEDVAGISHFIEHLCFKGTSWRPSPKDISSEIEGIGGVLNASTGREETVYWAKVTRPHVTTAIDLLFDMTTHSTFNETELEKERQVVIEEINMNLDIPQQRLSMLIDNLLWPDQPLGRDIAGTKETVSKVDRSTIVGYARGHYLAGDTVVCVAGDLEHDDVLSEIASRCGDLPPGALSRNYRTDPEQCEPRIGVDRRDGEQVHICVAVHGVSRCDRRRYAVDALSVILGGGMSSRLFTEIREKRGLAYDIHSYAEHFRSSGTVVVYAGVDPGRVEECITAMLYELSCIRQGPAEEELRHAKELMKGRLELRLEDTQNMALWCGGQQLLDGRIQNVDEVTAGIDGVTVRDVTAVAEELLATEYLNLAIVGPLESVSSPELPAL